MANDKPTDLYNMIRRALTAQVEMGMPEVILNTAATSSEQMSSRIASVEEALSASSPAAPAEYSGSLFGEPEPTHTEPQFDSLEEHYEAICNCQKCPLGQTRNKFVYGAGNPKAEVMFVGEAPGADEDRLGEPFVGRAGQLLDKILAAIKFDRTQIYIANILKCRPPGNRDPQPDEMAQCFPYLKEQVALIQPKLICALGRIAAQAMLDTKTPLGKLRGRWHEYEGVPMLVTYHPAALLRNPAFKRGTWEDVQLLRQRYDEQVG
ncbi:MAG TPA: uracil-DNA glycosylase [candidate division Zixibacteria bacterium]|nr:uracil-DNA glycosylase [candidate division Zixibacteria bacterium]